MFEDKVDREELDKMPSEYKELLERVLTIHTESASAKVDPP